MKKSLFFVAAAALFAACSQDNETPEIALENNAISFSAYTSTATTRGTVVNSTVLTDVGADGIGVFAFYQPATNGIAGADYTTIKYPTPNFMYNQQVNCKTAADTWEYSPIKYWPNNTNDKISFFAYAPYKSNTTWEDLGVTTDATGNTINKSFVIYPDIEDQVDYLFAEPTLNMLKPTGTISTTGTGQGKLTDGSDVVKFNFQHMTSKVNLFVGVETDANTAITPTGSPQAWTDANTTIEIQSIEFKDLAQTFTWSKTGSNAATFSTTGKQDIVAYPYTKAAVYTQVAAKTKADGTTTYYDDANGSNPQVYSAKTVVTGKYTLTTPAVNFGLIDNTWTAVWHRYLKGDQATPSTTTANDEYMFIAPQTLSTQEIVITYVVKTTDSGNKYNSSTVTNTITKTWADFRNDDFTQFVSGKQYNLYFLIGMQSVKLAATVTGWDNGTDHVVDVPTAY